MCEKSKNPVGIFDSGIGGLTVMKEIVKLLPNEDIIYFGDTARLPYGEKSPETILRYSIENAEFLLEQNIKVLVIACNTASAYAIDHLTKVLDIPVLGVIQPGALKAVNLTKTKEIAVLGTKATVKSLAYQKEIQNYLPECAPIAIPCPLFVPFVEEGFFDHLATELIAKEYLAPILNSNVDTVLLGCTHYPFLKDLIQKILGDKRRIVDSAFTCAEELKTLLIEHALLNNGSEGKYTYFVSDDEEKFARLGHKFFGNAITSMLVKDSLQTVKN